jgi:hypothetical protein
VCVVAEGFVVVTNAACPRIVYTCHVQAGAECTPPLTTPTPPPSIRPASFAYTTSPSEPLIRLQAQGWYLALNVETACRLGYVGVRGDKTGKTPGSMGMSLGIGAHARAVWAVDAPHTDVVHANTSVRAEKRYGQPLHYTSSYPLIRLQAKGWQLSGVLLQRGGMALLM